MAWAAGLFALGLFAETVALADSHPCLARVRAQDEALRRDTKRLRLRHNIERVIRAWRRAKSRCPKEAEGRAVQGHAEALALLAHWSGRSDDRARARSALARARRVAEGQNKAPRRAKSAEQNPSTIVAQIRSEMRAAHPDIVAQLEGRPGSGPCCTTVRRIVLDPGHGGRDAGASAHGALREKDINLAIARRLETELEERYGVDVLLTRSRDRFMSLNERVRFAKRHRADLFVSIHANAHRSASVHGIETYYTTRARPDVSQQFARAIQRSLVVKVRNLYGNVRDLGVKRGRFHVLRASRMPALLIETGFITHKREGKRLASARYQNEVAEAIADGIGRLITGPERLAQHAVRAPDRGSVRGSVRRSEAP